MDVGAADSTFGPDTMICPGPEPTAAIAAFTAAKASVPKQMVSEDPFVQFWLSPTTLADVYELIVVPAGMPGPPMIFPTEEDVNGWDVAHVNVVSVVIAPSVTFTASFAAPSALIGTPPDAGCHKIVPDGPAVSTHPSCAPDGRLAASATPDGTVSAVSLDI
jgi:hypothetical protein